MDELSVVDRFRDWVQGSIAELRHLLLTEGLPLLSEELGDQLSLDVPGVLRVQRPEGGQQVLMGGGQELLLQDDPVKESRDVIGQCSFHTWTSRAEICPYGYIPSAQNLPSR